MSINEGTAGAQYAGRSGLINIKRDDANYTTCMLRMPRGSASLRGGREGRVVHLWVSQARPLFLPRRRAAHLKLATERRLEQLGRKFSGRN